MFFLQFIAISCFSPDKLVDKFIVHTIIVFEATLLDIKYQARARSAGENIRQKFHTDRAIEEQG